MDYWKDKIKLAEEITGFPPRPCDCYYKRGRSLRYSVRESHQLNPLMHHMKLIFFVLTSLMSAPSMAQQIQELPLFVKFKDVPINENPVGGYATLGTFTDGLPAVEVVAVDVVQFFERIKLTPMFPYQKVQINCRLGLMKIVGMGDASEIRNIAIIKDTQTINLKDTHPANYQVYEKICKAGGFKLKIIKQAQKN